MFASVKSHVMAIIGRFLACREKRQEAAVLELREYRYDRSMIDQIDPDFVLENTKIFASVDASGSKELANSSVHECSDERAPWPRKGGRRYDGGSSGAMVVGQCLRYAV